MVNTAHPTYIAGKNTGYSVMGSVLLAYVTLSVAMTWPLTMHVNSALFGDFGDARGGIWSLWTGIHSLRNTPVCDLVSAPFGLNIGLIPNQPLSETLMYLLARLFGEVAAYNIFILFAFPATAFATFIMLFSITDRKLASFVGGLIFGFSPAAVMQVVGGHASFAFNVFIPMFFLALLYNREKRSLFSSLLVGLNFALLTLNAIYFGYFVFFVALYFIIFDYATTQGVPGKKFFLNYLIGAGMAIAIIVPFQYKMLINLFTATSTNLAKAGHARGFY